MNKPIQELRSHYRPLRILDTAVQKSSGDPLEGFLEISTEDGILRLSISSDAARDMQIDLNQFIGDG